MMLRSELFELLCNEPPSQVAKHLGVSDTWVRKVRAKHAIPIPGRGYWNMRAAGLEVEDKPVLQGNEFEIELGNPDAVEVGSAAIPSAPIVSRSPARIRGLAEAVSQFVAVELQRGMDEAMPSASQDAARSYLAPNVSLSLGELDRRIAGEVQRWVGQREARPHAVDSGLAAVHD